jgi:hypothetical protein
MSANPYQSPPNIPSTADSPTRRSAVAAFRTAFVILLTPALFNYFAFDAMMSAGVSARLHVLFRAANLAGFAAASVLIWFFGVPLLEAASRTIRRVFARDASRESWDGALYVSLKPMAYLAAPGAVLWAVWVVGFYFLQVEFVAISLGVGIPGHILGACLYVPLLMRWYQVSRRDSADQEYADPHSN